MLKASKELEIKAAGSEYTIISGIGSRSFPLDKEIDEPLPDGNALKVKTIFFIKLVMIALVFNHRALHPFLVIS